MKVHSAQLEVQTEGKGTYNVTGQIGKVVAESRIGAGTVTVFVQHTSASLIIFEDADPSARVDLEKYFERLVPENTNYFTHTDEGPDDSTSHIRMVLTRTSEVIPIIESQLHLGTWQGVFLFEHRRLPHTRRLSVVVIGE